MEKQQTLALHKHWTDAIQDEQQAQEKAQQHETGRTTVTLAASAGGGPIVQQFIMERKTEAVHPVGLCCSTRRSHTRRPIGATRLECALQHSAQQRESAEFMDEAKAKFPRCYLVYVQANTAPVNQMLDIAYLSSCKKKLQSAASQILPRQLVNGVNPLSKVTLRSKITGSVEDAVQDMDEWAGRVAGWRHSLVRDEDKERVFDDADMWQREERPLGPLGQEDPPWNTPTRTRTTARNKSSPRQTRTATRSTKEGRREEVLASPYLTSSLRGWTGARGGAGRCPPSLVHQPISRSLQRVRADMPPTMVDMAARGGV